MQILEQAFDLDEFLSRPLFAHLATSSDDGPRESPVWFLWEDGAIWLIGTENDSYVKRLRRDPRAAIGIVDFDLERGFLQHVGLRGTTVILPADRTRLHRFLARYLGDESSWNPKFTTNVIDGIDTMIRFIPETIVARDQSYFK